MGKKQQRRRKKEDWGRNDEEKRRIENPLRCARGAVRRDDASDEECGRESTLLLERKEVRRCYNQSTFPLTGGQGSVQGC